MFEHVACCDIDNVSILQLSLILLALELEKQMEREGEDFLSINVFLTKRMKDEEKEDLKARQSESERDIWTNLKAKTNFGRPNFKQIFTDLRDEHKGNKVRFCVFESFFCFSEPL